MAQPRTVGGQFEPRPATPTDLSSEKTGGQADQGTTGGNGRIPSPYGENAIWVPDAALNYSPQNNSMAFPGWNHQGMYTGTYATYRWMWQHPIIRYAESVATSIIEASTWEYEKVKTTRRPDAPDEWLNLVTEVFDALRASLIRDFYIEGRRMAWAPGEIIWKNEDDLLKIERVKPLVQDISELLQDKFGNIVGGVNYANPDQNSTGEIRLAAPFKFFYYAHLPTAGNPYGESWLEGCRATAWKDWMKCAQQIDKLANKITGVVTVITSPAGTFPGAEPGKTVTYQANAEKVIKALANGAAGVWMPSIGITPDARGNVDAIKLMAELAGKSLTNIQVLDFGQQSAAIEPILERMKHNEELMFNAGLRSARTGLEAEHGTKAEAGVHTDTGTVNAETDDERFARWCQVLVDALLVANFGQRAKGRVRIKPPSLVDRKSSVLRAFLLAIGNSTEVQRELAATADVTRILRVLDVPLLPGKKYDPEAVQKDVEAGRKKPDPGPNKQPEPQGGRPSGTKAKPKPTKRKT